jgi:DNA polymerase III delta subunit
LVQVYFSTLELKEIEKKENDSTFIINKNEKITKNFLFDSYIDLIELIDDIEYDFESILLLTKTMDFFGFEKNIKTNLNMKRIVEFSTNDLEKKIAKKGGHPLTVKKKSISFK